MSRSQADPALRPDTMGTEVRPEELTELVERLHREQERLSVFDVAETLGVSPEAVSSTLRAMRSERVPPMVSPKRSARPRSRARRFRIVATAVGCVLLGCGIFTAGQESGYKSGRRMGAYPQAARLAPDTLATTDDLARRLRRALPSGARLSVGNVTYIGAPGEVYASEEDLTPLIEALMIREAREPDWRPSARTTVSGWPQSVVTAIERPTHDDAFEGLLWEPLRIDFGGKSYATQWPRRTGALESSETIEHALSSKRHRAAEAAANRISEWAASRRS